MSRWSYCALMAHGDPAIVSLVHLRHDVVRGRDQVPKRTPQGGVPLHDDNVGNPNPSRRGSAEHEARAARGELHPFVAMPELFTGTMRTTDKVGRQLKAGA
jgi:hypothetical protein